MDDPRDRDAELCRLNGLPLDSFDVQREEAFRVAIEFAERGDTMSLAALLHSRDEPSKAARHWLAEVFDPASKGEFAADIRRRRRGRPSQERDGSADLQRLSRLLCVADRALNGDDPFSAKLDALSAELHRLLAANPHHLASLLRGSGPFSPFLKRWLADIFDPKSDGEFAVVIRRRRPGKPSKVKWRLIAVATHVVANLGPRIDHGKGACETVDGLINDGVEKYRIPGHKPISRTSVVDYLKSRWPDLSATLKEAKQASRKAKN